MQNVAGREGRWEREEVWTIGTRQVAQCLPTEIQVFSAEKRMEESEGSGQEVGGGERRESEQFYIFSVQARGAEWVWSTMNGSSQDCVWCAGWMEGSREQGEQQVRDLLQTRMTVSNPGNRLKWSFTGLQKRGCGLAGA